MPDKGFEGQGLQILQMYFKASRFSQEETCIDNDMVYFSINQ